jgi:serine/threonine protein kinase
MQYTQFGKYLLLDRIAVGGMAEVHRAKSFGVEGFEKILAIKKILPHVAEDVEFVEMFINEAKIASQLTHSNITQIFDLGKIDGNLFIAMEYVWGKDLLQMINYFRRRRESMPAPMAVYIATRVCEGIDYAYHKRGAHGKPLKIIHRDVSPQNVLISYDGEVKIIDFGIAKATLHHSETQAGLLKGKFSYMSPEQVQGFPIDHRSDIFAIGTCLFEMLTSQSLFRGENDFITLERVRKAEVPKPTDINPKIPKSLEKIVMKALALDPKDRWQRAADFQDALQRFLITSPPIYTAKRLADWIKLTFSGDIDADKGRMEEYAKLGPEVLRRSIPPSRPPSKPQKKVPAKTVMGMPAVGGPPPAAPPGQPAAPPGQPAPPARPPAAGGPPVGAVARPIAEVKSGAKPETTKPGGGAPPPPGIARQVSKPPPPPGGPKPMPPPTGGGAVAATLPQTPSPLAAGGPPPPMPSQSTPVTGPPQDSAPKPAPGSVAGKKDQKIIAIPKGPGAGSGMTTTAVKGDLELDYEEDEEPTQALDREASELDALLGGKIELSDEVVYSDKPVARRPDQPASPAASPAAPRMSYPPGTMIGPDGQPTAIPMPPPRKAGFNPIWILVIVISFVVLGLGGVVSYKLLWEDKSTEESMAGELAPDQAAIDLRVVPSSARVSINGKEVPQDKVGFPIPIPVNTAVDVEVWKEGYKREAFQILAGPREKIRKEIALAELRGRVMVNSVPDKAQVYMDSVLKGDTPITLDDFPIDRRVNVSVKMDGKETWAEVVELKEDKPERTLVAILQEPGKAVAKADVPKVTPPKVVTPPKTTPKKTTPKKTTPKKTTPKKTTPTPPPPKETSGGGGGEKGGLIAHTTPWARVIVDGKDSGRNTPIVPKKPIMLPPGKHKVTFKIQSTGETFTFPVNIKSGQNTKLVKKLK